MHAILTGNEITPEFSSTQNVSLVHVSLGDKGLVALEAQHPGAIQWETVATRQGWFCVITPDPGVKYRFRAINVEGNAEVYFGPTN